MKPETKDLKEKTNKNECNSTDIKIKESLIYLEGFGDNKKSNNITLVVTNFGTIPLGNWKLDIFWKKKSSVTELEPVVDKKIKSKYESLKFNNIGNISQIDRIKLTSSDCPNRATYTCDYEGSGKFSC